MNLICLLVALITGYTVDAHFVERFKTLRRPVPVDIEDPFILTPLIEAGQLDEAKNRARVNYTDFKDIEFYSGYLQVDKVFDNNLFFYFFPSEGNFKEDPVILWLQGGPGSPAGYGLFVENGPFIINEDYSVDLREFRWSKNHSLLYIDSPVGTGFSFTTRQGYAQNQTKVGDDLYEALIQFFILFSEIQQNDFFVVGESYGGKYVPAIGYTILQNNPSGSLKINLKGLAIGNGLSDPMNQGNYGDYLYQLGFVDANTRDLLHQCWYLAQEAIKAEEWTEATKYFDDEMNRAIHNSTWLVSESNYLQLEFDETEYWQIFIQDQLRNALHIGNTQFNGGPVFMYLYDDIAKSVAPWISELLNYYQFLVYNGQLDIIVAYPMTVNYLQNLNFSAAEEYKTATRQIWSDNDGVAGYYKSAGNLTELLVRNAGHMVPIEQPKRAYWMIHNFVRGLPFSNKYN